MDQSKRPRWQASSDDESGGPESVRPAQAAAGAPLAASPRLRLSTLVAIVLPFVILVIAAYVQWLAVPGQTQPNPQA